MTRRRGLAAATLAVFVLAAWGGSFRRVPPPPSAVPPPSTWAAGPLTVAWIGHASVLIRMGDAWILTDPAFYARIGVTLGPVTVGPRRLVAAALRPEDLPALDAVIVSHAHMDSLDRPSLAAVARRTGVLVVPEDTADLVDDLDFPRVVELGWGGRVDAGPVRVEAVEVRHWGERWPWDDRRGYNGYLLARGETSALFAPDTAYTPALGRLAAREPLTAAIIGNGAYDPWIHNHADPEQVWRMFTETGARFLLPIHADTFRLGREPPGDALARLLAAAGGEARRVVIRRVGDTWSLGSG